MIRSVPRAAGALALAVWLFAPAVDELCSAAPTVGAPDFQVDLGLSVTEVFLYGTVIPVVVSMIVEPPLLWWSDGRSRRGSLLGSGVAWAAGYAICAFAPNALVLALGLAVVFVAAGIALSLARAELVASDGSVELQLARWMVWGSVGDLLGPVAFAGIAALGGGWRTGMAGCAFAVAAWVAGVATRPAVGVDEDEDEDVAGPAAWRNPTLLTWLAAVAACTLLDEIFVAGTALYGTSVLGLDLTQVGLLIAADMTGGVLGSAALERWGAPRAALIPACLVSMAGLAFLLAAPGPALAAGGLFVCGFGVGAQYPLVLAAAHRALPGRPGAVEALQTAFLPVDLVAPLAFGLAADAWGLGPALALLGLQPVVILAVAAATRGR